MKMPTITYLALASALALAPLVPVHAQADPGAQQGSQNQGFEPPLIVKASALRTYYFTPQHVRTRELRELADRLYGRQLFISDRGGLSGPPVENIQQLGDTLLIYDTAEYAQMLGEALHSMDLAMAEETPEPSVPASLETAVSTWRPRHIGLSVASSALTSFRRDTLVYDDRGNSSRVPNVSVVGDLGQLVLRDTSDQVKQMVDMLDSIDKPEQQMYITCLVIRGQHMPGDGQNPVPEELASNLAKLVPYEHFELLTMGVLRASAIASQLELRMDDSYRIDLQNQGYDPESKSLTALCAFAGTNNQRLETRTTIRAGEYTVLGATGQQPLFAVLKIEPIDD